MPLALPAEWEPHERCLVVWPGEQLVSRRLITAAKADYGLVVRAISAYEPITVIAKPGFAADATAYCGSEVEVVELEASDAWIRDSGPIFVRDRGRLLALDFVFNGYGGKPAVGTLGPALAEWLGIEHRRAHFVLEGGSITVDGRGTLVATAPTVEDDERNPDVTRSELETAFSELLGADRTIWLEHGLLEDGTGGHVDNVARFVGPGRILCQTVRDAADPNHDGLAANRAALEAAGLDVTELDVLPYRDWAGKRIALPYLNFYLANGAVIVPLACMQSDEDGLARLRDVFPDREVVGVPATNLARRGGGPHCITQQVPLDVRRRRSAGNEVDQLEVGHLGRVTLTGAELDDPRVAARPI
jgi:agmatine deiminase